MDVGFVGLGRMGSHICGHILKAGHSVTAYDIRPEAVDELKKRGAAPGRSPKDVASGSEIVFTSLPHPEISRELLENPGMPALAGFDALDDGLARADPAGQLVGRDDHAVGGAHRLGRIRVPPARRGLSGLRAPLGRLRSAGGDTQASGEGEQASAPERA